MFEELSRNAVEAKISRAGGANVNLPRTRGIVARLHQIAILLLAAMLACDGADQSREFTQTWSDGSELRLRLFRKSTVDPREKGAPGYFYHLAIRTQLTFDPILDGIGCPADQSHEGFFTHVRIKFYDSDGMPLYRDFSESSLAPGFNNNSDEIKKTSDGWEWKGVIGADKLIATDLGQIHDVEFEPEVGDCSMSRTLRGR